MRSAADYHASKKPRPQSEQDRVQKEITAAVEKALVDSMRPMIEAEPCKLVRSFQPHQVASMAVAAITAYIQARGRAEKVFLMGMELNDPIDDLWRG